MITATAPMLGTAASLSVENYLAYSGIASALLIVALILQELLDTGGEENSRRATIKALDIIVKPLSLVFAVTIAYKILQVLRF